MKNLFSALLISSFLLNSIVCFSFKNNEDIDGEPTAIQVLQIVSSPELYVLSTGWVSGFGNLHPEHKVSLSCQTDLPTLEKDNLYLYANQSKVGNDSNWKMIIAHDLVVPVINSRNPILREIINKGFTAGDFAKIISESPDWSTVINSVSKIPIQFYIVDNQQVITKVTRFTKTEPSSAQVTKVANSAELISLIKNNEHAVGFCTLNDALNNERDGFADQICIIPIDKNRNGRIDNFENIYVNPETLTRAAWIGKYPRELCGNIYAKATIKPTNQAALDFMIYISSEGQDYIKKTGYSVLSYVEKAANMALLTNPVKPLEPGSKSTLTPLMQVFVIALLTLAVISLIFLLFKRRKKTTIDCDDIEITPALNENSILAPRGLYYDKTHTWAFMEQDGLVKIGVDDFLKHVTGQITQLKMKSSGEKVRKGEKILTIIRNGKQLNLYSPISGFIKKINTLLSYNPQKINLLTLTNGWIYQVEPVNWKRESSFMLMFDKYREWLEDEFVRLKDFLATSANSNSVVYEHVILQDGGQLKDNVLADLGPEVWEDFQTKFIDSSK